MKTLEILETNEGFYFMNYDKFNPVFKSPYISLSKKEVVAGNKVTFDILDFINLIDLCWNTKGRKKEIKLMKVGKAKDYRHALTGIAVWENRRINSNKTDRKGLFCGLWMNVQFNEKIYKILKEAKK
jgi:hypothetical protein